MTSSCQVPLVVKQRNAPRWSNWTSLLTTPSRNDKNNDLIHCTIITQSIVFTKNTQTLAARGGIPDSKNGHSSSHSFYHCEMELSASSFSCSTWARSAVCLSSCASRISNGSGLDFHPWKARMILICLWRYEYQPDTKVGEGRWGISHAFVLFRLALHSQHLLGLL